jgi:glycosyltransferase involved in cell wall biosynthesis
VRVVVGSPVWSLNGVNTFAATLTRGLVGLGIDARILLTGVTYRERKPIPLPLDAPHEYLRIPRVAPWSARRKALAEYLEGQAPCVYLPNHDFLHSVVTSRLSAGVAVIGIVHSDDRQHYDHAARMGHTWNATVAVSDRIAQKLREASGSGGAIDVIPYGVAGAEEYRPRPASDTLRLFYSGRLEARQKRVRDLVEIASALMARGVKFTLTICGNGPERDPLEREIAARGLSSVIRMTGPLANDEISPMCAGHDVFLLTSAYEGMPISLLEAMGQGCVPVVSYVASGIPELIRDGRNGFVVPVGDIGGFAGKLAELSETRSLIGTMGREAWRTVTGGAYRADVMTARYADLFKRVRSEIEAGNIPRRDQTSSGSVPLTLRERVTAPLWYLSSALRAQQGQQQ